MRKVRDQKESGGGRQVYQENQVQNWGRCNKNNRISAVRRLHCYGIAMMQGKVFAGVCRIIRTRRTRTEPRRTTPKS